MSSDENITRLLHDAEEGREGAMEALMAAVYEDLERVAAHHLGARYGQDLAGVTMEPAALVNESFLKLIKQRKAYENRGQFFAIATRVMLRVLVDYQRRRLSSKRGGDRQRVALDLDRPVGTAGAAPAPTDTGTRIGVNRLVQALDRLDALDQRKADVVRLRVVWGLEMREIAESLDVSLATVERDWAFAKAWLAREAAGEAADEDAPDEDAPSEDKR